MQSELLSIISFHLGIYGTIYKVTYESFCTFLKVNEETKKEQAVFIARSWGQNTHSSKSSVGNIFRNVNVESQQ